MGTMFLHGDLELKILEARNLPRPSWGSLLRDKLSRHQPSISDDDDTKSDDQLLSTFPKKSSRGIYVAVNIAGARVARTQVQPKSQNPTWNQSFNIPLAHPKFQMVLQLTKKKNKLLGVATVAVEIVSTTQPTVQWFPVTGRRVKPKSEIKLQICFTPCQDNPIYQRGIWDNYQVNESYFPMRCGGKLRLYQDAHVMDGNMPDIKLDEGINYKHQKCWEEICHAISEARHLVYIVGWCVNTEVKLIREPTRPFPENGDFSLGELLKAKSRQGVRTLMLVWDDKTSLRFLPRIEGVMKTHDEQTRRFFKNSLVKCSLVPCYTNNGVRHLKEQARRALYAHHQKCVIVDMQGDGNKRELTAFIGGLDLCEGRYDTPEHRLFRDLDTVFEDDYGHSKVKGPRQAWHDLHCKIEGAAASDVLTNFEQRWRKTSKWSDTGNWIKRTAFGWKDDVLLDMKNISWITNPSHFNQDDPQNWHIQVFRSIDSGSVKGFPNNANAAYEQNLVYDKRKILDRSIERAYIQAIRSARRFIYIENQYFIGSSYVWPESDHEKPPGVTNSIPMELALKIANKIRAKERFCVYIVIPMWPEGDSISGQEIVRLQRQTMAKMYEVVAKELKSARLVNARPTDYLNFYCLGNREQFVGPNPTSVYHGIPEESGRGFIYVHSKGMIVDDAYVIIGSANINDRSMVGSRDTEIAMGAYQPYYLRNQIQHRSQVYGYRMSLWAEHIGSIQKCFEAPESMDCLTYVNRVAENNWRRYTAHEFSLLQGHILKYPIQVDIHGNVEALPGFETFPKVGGRFVRKLTTIIIANVPAATRWRNRLVR